MKQEIRKEIRQYILNEVNMTLARLGVSENVKETEEYNNKYDDTLQYQFESAPIRQMPMMFKKAYVDGSMVSIEIKDEEDRLFWLTNEKDIVVVNLHYRWDSFGCGSNGTELGRMVFAVNKDLPAKFGGYDSRSLYVHKIEGLTI